MKKIVVLLVLLTSCFWFYSCDGENLNGNDNPEHEHAFVEGKCDCGETDPSYEAPHKHAYVEGKCECGEVDPNYETTVSPTDEEYTLFFEKVESYVRQFIKKNEKGDINLKTKYYSTGATITYASSKPDIITNEGIYIEHEFDEEVILTATIEWEGKTHVFEIEFVSTGIPDSEKLAKVKEWLDKYISSVDLHEGLVLPTTHPDYGGRIRWVCENAGLIVDYKTLNLPKERGHYRLMAEIYFLNAHEIVKYPVTLMATELTDEQRIINFVKQSFVSTEGDFINLYEGSSVIINTDYLIDVNDDKIVSHVHSGVKPTVAQSFLDEEIYSGYELKNKEQVVWIVVHESGMVTPGVDAEFLAKSQWNSAYYGTSRNASWNYQVDDGAIYQSYGDDIYCWHASSRRGNSNSIGIEMCVNPEGDFNVAMRNDARLIAYFLHKYNLGMLNVKQHHDFAPDGKNCPENIRNDHRWFELLGMISREYASQELLKDVEVTYNILSNNLKERSLAGIYEVTDGKEVKVEVTVLGQNFPMSVENE